MPRLLRATGFVDDNIEVLPKDFSGGIHGQSALVPLRYWLEHRDSLRATPSIGVWLDSDDDPGALAADAAGLNCIGIHFPGFMDGRGFSSARLLRERYRFSGELRALGRIIADQLFYLRRCGFDSFTLTGELPEECLPAFFDTFSNSYQASTDQPLPLFRRRIASRPPT